MKASQAIPQTCTKHPNISTTTGTSTFLCKSRGGVNGGGGQKGRRRGEEGRLLVPQSITDNANYSALGQYLVVLIASKDIPY